MVNAFVFALKREYRFIPPPLNDKGEFASASVFALSDPRDSVNEYTCHHQRFVQTLNAPPLMSMRSLLSNTYQGIKGAVINYLPSAPHPLLYTVVRWQSQYYYWLGDNRLIWNQVEVLFIPVTIMYNIQYLTKLPLPAENVKPR